MLSHCQTTVENLSVINNSSSQAKKGMQYHALSAVLPSDLFLNKKMVESSIL